mmetsp:Transcript_13898/g.33391  ORF Transcript_13898/g.33391 Transcript_13898/m.33391 type:complete len:163 (+) Transcript_13898:136-624(+)
MLKRQKPTVIYYDFNDVLQGSPASAGRKQMDGSSRSSDVAPTPTHKLACLRRSTSSKRTSKTLSSVQESDSTSYLDDPSASQFDETRTTASRTESVGKLAEMRDEEDGIAPPASSPFACLVKAARPPLRRNSTSGSNRGLGSRSAAASSAKKGSAESEYAEI